jgi:hypothetical protein
MKKKIEFNVYVTVLVDNSKPEMKGINYDEQLVEKLIKNRFLDSMPLIASGGVEIEEFFSWRNRGRINNHLTHATNQAH